ncbi:transcriptional regulator with XRE-family HTH domain [Sinobacterium caligoides]|uniref:Transcriptional regulator with XRE-family HTH domain n=1 Tax=Sinobacterium caligoides TaxID=933926 RepID=A0A3N2DR74_9GAMM|nr:helix-turn-helix domain-containing protein [Sinobacterium caligoides]ROS01795.1 transcriptional regulator with XRE-family HTH domain [Sinobacterium caligoides]
MVKFAGAETFGQVLKALRKAQGLSQMAFAERANTTTRNISNLETGKTTPTRSMVKRLSTCLQSSDQSYSELMRVAGFAYDSHSNNEVEEYQGEVQLAVDLLLSRHSPYPAIVVNRRYEVIQINEGFRAALIFLMGDSYSELKLPISLFNVLFGLDAFNDSFVERERYTRFLIQRVYREQLNNIDSASLINELRSELPHIPDSWWSFDPHYQPSPNLRTDLQILGESYEALGVLQSIGSPHDLGGNSTRVILVYPLNEPAEQLFNSWG